MVCDAICLGLPHVGLESLSLHQREMERLATMSACSNRKVNALLDLLGLARSGDVVSILKGKYPLREKMRQIPLTRCISELHRFLCTHNVVRVWAELDNPYLTSEEIKTWADDERGKFVERVRDIVSCTADIQNADLLYKNHARNLEMLRDDTPVGLPQRLGTYKPLLDALDFVDFVQTLPAMSVLTSKRLKEHAVYIGRVWWAQLMEATIAWAYNMCPKKHSERARN